MKKSKILFIIFIAAITGCKVSDTKDDLILLSNVSSEPSKMQREFQLLSSSLELNRCISQEENGVVDWELSKEFAELTLEEFKSDEEFSSTSYVWDYPICIYSDDGSIRYYEFRIIDGTEIVGAIACNAQEKYGPPVDKVFKTSGYLSELSEMFDKEILCEADLPRIIDNLYPSHVIAISNLSRSGDIDVNYMIDPVSGTEVTELNKILTVEESFEIYPDLYTEEQKELAIYEIENYKDELSSLWKCAKERKGAISGESTRGVSLYYSNELPILALLNTYNYHTRMNPVSLIDTYRTAISYGACGATATGFVLDYLDANNIGVSSEWANASYELRRELLYTYLKVGTVSSGITIPNITWPDNLETPIKNLSLYKLEQDLDVICKNSIDRGLPGISLRCLNPTSIKNLLGGMHYRNVIGYKQTGWWIFSYSQMKILDGNNVDSNCINGTWETWVPIYHLNVWNVNRKI